MKGQRFLLAAVTWTMFAIFTGFLVTFSGLPFWAGLMVGAVALPVVGPLVTGGIGRNVGSPRLDGQEIRGRVVVHHVVTMAIVYSSLLGAVLLIRWLSRVS